MRDGGGERVGREGGESGGEERSDELKFLFLNRTSYRFAPALGPDFARRFDPRPISPFPRFGEIPVHNLLNTRFLELECWMRLLKNCRYHSVLTPRQVVPFPFPPRPQQA